MEFSLSRLPRVARPWEQDTGSSASTPVEKHG